MKERYRDIIFWIILFGFILITIISISFGIFNRSEEIVFDLEVNCIESYDFYYYDYCGDDSYAIDFFTGKRIEGEFLEININEHKYNILSERCIGLLEVGCGVYDGEI